MKPAVLESGRTRYVVQDFLTEGGMGAIYLGRRIDASGREDEVILKALLPELIVEPALVELFLREARLTASLAHPHIVRTLDLVAGQGTWFIVMEYVVGADLRTLERRARRRGRQLAPQLALHVGLSMLEALDYAHRRLTPDGRPLGLIHRDISPSNILVDGEGHAWLSDFGIAKLATHRSTFHRVKGKLGYMAPEQARGDPVDVRTDLFALAICIHEGLCGERLYPHAAASPTVTSVYAQRPARPSERRHGLPRDLDLALDRALALDPAARFPSAAEMRMTLLRIADRHGLLWSDAQAGAHLREACGDDPRAWLRGDVTAPPHHTEAYVSGGDGHDDDEEESLPRRGRNRIFDGTALTSLLEPRAPLQPEPFTPSPDDIATRAGPPALVTPAPPPRSAWPEEVTALAFDGEATRIKSHSPPPDPDTRDLRDLRPRPRAEPTVPMQTLPRDSPPPAPREPDTALRNLPPPGTLAWLQSLELSGRPLQLALGGALLLGLFLGLVIGVLIAG